jgi:hypothetical protein
MTLWPPAKPLVRWIAIEFALSRMMPPLDLTDDDKRLRMLRFEVKGYCPVCEQKTAFVAEREEDLAHEWWGHWFRAT